jgi:hypothetical protein
MYKVFALFAAAYISYFPQTLQMLSKRLPVVIKVNDFGEAVELELLLRERLTEKSISVITQGKMMDLSYAESQRAAQRFHYQIRKDMDMNAYVRNVMNAMSVVAERLTVTVVTDKQGLLDSCYFEVSKVPDPNRKKGAIPRFYITDSVVKKGNLSLLAKEITEITTGVKRR